MMYLRVEVILEVIMKVNVIWDMTPCNLVQTEISDESGTSINPVCNWASTELQGIFYQNSYCYTCVLLFDAAATI
jgi:hypothetical protein